MIAYLESELGAVLQSNDPTQNQLTQWEQRYNKQCIYYSRITALGRTEAMVKYTA